MLEEINKKNENNIWNIKMDKYYNEYKYMYWKVAKKFWFKKNWLWIIN